MASQLVNQLTDNQLKAVSVVVSQLANRAKVVSVADSRLANQLDSPPANQPAVNAEFSRARVVNQVKVVSAAVSQLASPHRVDSQLAVVSRTADNRASALVNPTVDSPTAASEIANPIDVPLRHHSK